MFNHQSSTVTNQVLKHQNTERERERERLLTVEFASEAERKSVEIWRRRVRAMIAFCYCLGAVNVKPF